MASQATADFKNGLQLYRDALELIGDKLGPAEQIRDNEWMEKTQVESQTALG
jgi:hypothetical protein